MIVCLFLSYEVGVYGYHFNRPTVYPIKHEPAYLKYIMGFKPKVYDAGRNSANCSQLQKIFCSQVSFPSFDVTVTDPKKYIENSDEICCFGMKPKTHP